MMPNQLPKSQLILLENSSPQLLLALEKSELGVWDWDVSAGILKYDLHFAQLLGYGEGAIQQSTIEELVHSEDLPRLQQAVQDHLTGKVQNFGLVIRLRSKSEDWRWMSLRGSTVKPDVLTGTMADAIGRREILQALEQSEVRFRSMYDQIGMGIALEDLHGKIVEANPALQRMLGYSLEELTHLKASMLVYPADLEKMRRSYRAVKHEKRPNKQVEVRFLRKNGDIAWGLITASLLRGSDENPLYLLILVEDVTEKRRMAEVLNAREQQLNNILESVKDVIWSFTPGFGSVIFLNKAVEDLSGRSVEAFKASPSLWYNMFHPEDYEIAREFMRKLADDGAVEASYRILRPDSSVRWVQTRAWLVRDADNNVIRIDGITADITLQKKAEIERLNIDAILQAISAIAEKFLATSSWETLVPQMLESLGKAVDASRIYLVERARKPDGRLFQVRRGVWTADGIPALKDLPLVDHVTLEEIGFQRWAEIFKQNQVVAGNSRLMPAAESQLLLQMGIFSTLNMPVFVNGEWWGIIGFDECRTERRWSQPEVDALRLAAEVLGAAIQRQRADDLIQRLYEAEREQRQLAQALREIGSVLSASLNYDAVLDQLLNQVGRLIDYDTASLALVVDGQARVARMRGYEKFEDEISEQVYASTFEVKAFPTLQWMVENQRSLVIPDTSTDPRWTPLAWDRWVGSSAAAPILIDGKVNAFLFLDKAKPNGYHLEQATLLAAFASQAALAVRNAILFDETVAALEREQNLNEVTQAISSNLDLQVILQKLVRLAVELVEADAGALSLVDVDGKMSYPYLFNLPQGLAWEREEQGVGLVWEVLQTGKTIRLNDYRTHPKARPDWISTGVCAFVGVPVMAGELHLGTLGLFSLHEGRVFTERQAALLDTVGRQTGVAIQNARNYEDARRRAEEAETLRQSVSAVTSALDLDQVLQKILVNLRRVVPYDSSAIFLVEEDYIQFVAGAGFKNLPELTSQKFPMDNDLINEIRRTNAPLILANAQEDPRFKGWGEAADTRGWMGLPLLVYDLPIGFLTIDSRRPHAYTPADAALGLAFASEVAIAVENARLFQKVQQMAITDPLTGAFNRRYFFETAERELERLKRYARPLSVVMIDIDYFKHVNDVFGHLAGDQALVEIARRIQINLREVDVLSRYGGEEFIILMPETPEDQASQAAERVRELVMSRPILVNSQEINISVSLGVARMDPGEADIQTLLHRADQALYYSKDTGRGRVTVWTQEMG